jgi:integrase
MCLIRAVYDCQEVKTMAKTHLKLVTPAIKKRAVTPRRQPNSELRSREHLTETEVEKLIEAAKDNRHGHRDATMILVAYRHGLRASEVCDLRWEQIDWNSATLHVRRVKSGKPSTHPVRGDELRALRKLQREAPKSPFVFVSERGGPFTTDSFNWMVKRAGQKAGLPFQVHAHMLRHAAGYKLAGDIDQLPSVGPGQVLAESDGPSPGSSSPLFRG